MQGSGKEPEPQPTDFDADPTSINSGTVLLGELQTWGDLRGTFPRPHHNGYTRRPSPGDSCTATSRDPMLPVLSISHGPHTVRSAGR